MILLMSNTQIPGLSSKKCGTTFYISFKMFHKNTTFSIYATMLSKPYILVAYYWLIDFFLSLLI